MNKEAINNFIVRKEDKSITLERSFAAPLAPVWAAWTEADILCKWWAPAPWRCVIRSLDFREGGRWLYAMESPEGVRHWSYFDYETIRPKTSFTGTDGFCDEHGTPNAAMPMAKWENHFSESSGQTIVRIEITYPSEEDMERLLAMGFKEGIALDFRQLDELLAANKQAKEA